MSDFGSVGGDCGRIVKRRPFVLLIDGQSNAMGADSSGSKAVAAGISIWSKVSGRGGRFVPAEFGKTPLRNGSSAGQAGDSFNNVGVHFANCLRSSGRLHEDRPIWLIANWFPGESIGRWVGDGDASPNWRALIDVLDDVNAVHRAMYGDDVAIDHHIRLQGEYDCSSLSAFNSAESYGAAWHVWMDMLRALPFWSLRTTTTVQELWGWGRLEAGPPNNSRNDFLWTLRAGADSRIALISSEGAKPSLRRPPTHADGESLVMLGRRHFAAWAYMSLGMGALPLVPVNASGGAEVRRQLMRVKERVLLGLDDVRGGLEIEAYPGSHISLPPTEVARGIDIIVNVIGNGAVRLQRDRPIEKFTFDGRREDEIALSFGVYRLVPVRNEWIVEILVDRHALPQTCSADIVEGGFVDLQLARKIVVHNPSGIRDVAINLPAALQDGQDIKIIFADMVDNVDWKGNIPIGWEHKRQFRAGDGLALNWFADLGRWA